jgi:hypothetical protein
MKTGHLNEQGAAPLNDIEMKQHLGAISKLAEETGVPEDNVSALYLRELDDMAEHSVRDFLPLIISRKVKNILTA